MGYLDEEIVAVHFEIVELQRSPFARKQGDVMEQLSVSLSYLHYNHFLKGQMYFFLSLPENNSKFSMCILKQTFFYWCNYFFCS